MSEDKGKVLEWDDKIEKEDAFVLIPTGEYDFEVLKVERGKYNGGGKIDPCPQATVTLRLIKDGEPAGEVTENLKLHSKMEWLLCKFFRAIGQKKHGEPLVMKWNDVPASTGQCKVTTRKWKKDDGTEMESNQVEFLDPVDTTFPPKEEEAPAKAGWAKQ